MDDQYKLRAALWHVFGFFALPEAQQNIFFDKMCEFVRNTLLDTQYMSSNEEYQKEVVKFNLFRKKDNE